MKQTIKHFRGLLALFLVAGAFSGSVLGQEDLWKQQQAEASSLYQFGQYPEARTAAEKALGTAQTTFGSRHINFAKTKALLGNVLRSQEDHESALDHYREALSVFENAYGPYHPELLATKQYIAESQNALDTAESARPRRTVSPPAPPPPPAPEPKPPAQPEITYVPGTQAPALIGTDPTPPPPPRRDPPVESRPVEVRKPAAETVIPPKRPSAPEPVAPPPVKVQPEIVPLKPPPASKLRETTPPPLPVKEIPPPKEVPAPEAREATRPLWERDATEADRQLVLNVVNEYQLALKYKDRRLLRKIFPYANATIVGVDGVYDKKITSQMNSVRRFIDFVTTTKEDIEKQFSNIEVQVFDGIALMNADYKFFFKGDQTNTGKEIWSLVKTNEGWVITSAIWTERYPDR